MAMICSLQCAFCVASVFAGGVASARVLERVVFNNWAAGEHGDEASRHQQGQRHVDENERHDRRHAEESARGAMFWKLPNRLASSENCTGFQKASPEITIRMPTSMTPR